MKVNPIDASASKGKSKDIHLPSIDINFGSNRILYDRHSYALSILLTTLQRRCESNVGTRAAVWSYWS